MKCEVGREGFLLGPARSDHCLLSKSRSHRCLRTALSAVFPSAHHFHHLSPDPTEGFLGRVTGHKGCTLGDSLATAAYFSEVTAHIFLLLRSQDRLFTTLTLVM